MEGVSRSQGKWLHSHQDNQESCSSAPGLFGLASVQPKTLPLQGQPRMDPRQLALWQVGGNMSENPAGSASSPLVQKTLLNIQVLFGIPCCHLCTSGPVPRGTWQGLMWFFLISQLPKGFFSSNKWLQFLLGGDQSKGHGLQHKLEPLCVSLLCPWHLPLRSEGQLLSFPSCTAAKAFVNMLPLGRCCCRCVGERQLCIPHAPPALSHCTPSTGCAAQPPTREQNFVSLPRSTFLITFSTTLSCLSQWPNGEFRSLSKGQGRRKAGFTSVHGHSP